MQKKLAVVVMLAMVAMMALACSSTDKSDAPQVQEPAVAEPVVEEPVVEEPVVEEPVVEEPEAEEPAVEEPTAEEPAADEPAEEEPAAEEPVLEDSGAKELFGEANGFGGPVKVKVTKEGDKIVGVEVLSHSETPGISDNAINNIPGAIVEAQSADVDTISGCTMTSEAIINAVKQALAN